jgi:hypothetical protein
VVLTKNRKNSTTNPQCKPQVKLLVPRAPVAIVMLIIYNLAFLDVDSVLVSRLIMGKLRLHLCESFILLRAYRKLEYKKALVGYQA